MIKIEVNDNGKKTCVSCDAHIEGREKAVHEFYAVIKALSDIDESVLCDAMEKHVCGRNSDISDDMFGEDDDDDSES